MLGFAPLASVPLGAAAAEDISAYRILGQPVGLHYSAHVIGGGAYTITGQDVGLILAISPTSLNAIILTGSTAQRTFGFLMIRNFEMKAGDTKTLVVTVKDANDSPVNISGASIKWQCARSYGRTPDISKTTDDASITITNGPNGVFTVPLKPSDTENLSGIFHHEAEMTLAENISTVLSGTMKVDKALIRAT